MSKRFYWKKIRPILISVVLCCLFFLILMAITSNRTGNLTIYVDRTSATKTLSLSESSTLKNPTGKLVGPSINNAWNISMCGEDEDPNIISCIPNDTYLLDGDHSGDNYISYTFYVFNSGIESLDYTMSFDIENVDKNLDESIRVNFYVNDVLTSYAKENGSTREAEPGTVKFESDNVITSHTITDFAPDEFTKYSIVIWVEVDDPDTNNDKIGGSITLSMKFSVLGVV